MNNVHPKPGSLKPYSRTCPVKLSHPSTQESVVGLAIIDDQAGMTFVDPIVRQALKLPKKAMKASMQGIITIDGESAAKPCHIVHNLVVTPLDGQPNISLPPAIMQNTIPDASDQVPSRKEVEQTPGYAEYAPHFQESIGLPTIAVIGGDCMSAQFQKCRPNFYDNNH